MGLGRLGLRHGHIGLCRNRYAKQQYCAGNKNDFIHGVLLDKWL